MTDAVEDARRLYLRYASEMRMATQAHGKQKWLHLPQSACGACRVVAQDCDAASIALDLAVARQHPTRWSARS